MYITSKHKIYLTFFSVLVASISISSIYAAAAMPEPTGVPMSISPTGERVFQLEIGADQFHPLRLPPSTEHGPFEGALEKFRQGKHTEARSLLAEAKAKSDSPWLHCLHGYMCYRGLGGDLQILQAAMDLKSVTRAEGDEYKNMQEVANLILARIKAENAGNPYLLSLGIK